MCIVYLTQETVVADAVDMNVTLQAKFLDDIAKKRPADVQYLKDLEFIRRDVPKDETDDAKCEREAAQRRLLLVTLDYGEFIGHGDLLHCSQYVGKLLKFHHYGVLIEDQEIFHVPLKCSF